MLLFCGFSHSCFCKSLTETNEKRGILRAIWAEIAFKSAQEKSKETSEKTSKRKNGLFLNLFHLECSLELHESFLKEPPNIYGKKILFKGPACSFKQIWTLKHGISTPVAQLLGYLMAAVSCIVHHSGQAASTTGQARSLTCTGIFWWHRSSLCCACYTAPLPQLPLRKP